MRTTIPSSAITLTIDSDFAHVAMAGGAVRGICRGIPLDEPTALAMEQAVVEALNNAIEHGCHGRPGHPITARLELTADRLVCEVADDGAAVALEVRLRHACLFPEVLLERGRGLGIMRALMDEVRYERRADLNVVILSKRLPNESVNRAPVQAGADDDAPDKTPAN